MRIQTRLIHLTAQCCLILLLIGLRRAQSTTYAMTSFRWRHVRCSNRDWLLASTWPKQTQFRREVVYVCQQFFSRFQEMWLREYVGIGCDVCGGNCWKTVVVNQARLILSFLDLSNDFWTFSQTLGVSCLSFSAVYITWSRVWPSSLSVICFVDFVFTKYRHMID